MGYSTSPSTVNKIKADLTCFATGRSHTWMAPFPDGMGAFQWAYKLREARKIILDNPGKFPEFCRFAKRFTIEQVSDTEVQARIKSEGSQVTDGAVQSGDTPVHMETHGQIPQTIAGITSFMEVVNHWLKAQPTSEPFHYPEARLTDQELRKLVVFAKTRTPPWMVLRARGTQSITLMKFDPTVPAGARVTFDD